MSCVHSREEVTRNVLRQSCDDVGTIQNVTLVCCQSKPNLEKAGDDILPEEKDDFIQRMKQRSQNVLIKRAIEARTWFRPASP